MGVEGTSSINLQSFFRARLRLVLVALSLAAATAGGLTAVFAGENERAVVYRILLTSNRDGQARAYTVGADGSRLTPLLPHGRALDPVAVSHDGGTIAYQGSDGSMSGPIYVSRSDGSGLRRLVQDGGYGATPALSPDGSMLALRKGCTCSSDGIWIIGTDGHGLRRLASGVVGKADWSPDGKTLVFVRGQAHAAVVVRPLNGRERVVVRDNGAGGEEPTWSPDGRWIAYLSDHEADYENDRDHGSGLWVVQSNGTHLHRLYRTMGDGGWSAWAPDSRRLAFTILDASGDKLDVAVAGVEGGGMKPLRLSVGPRTRTGLERLTWSPDGRRIILVGHSGDDTDQIWSVGSNGSGLRALTGAGTNILAGLTRLAPVLSTVPSLPPSERVLGSDTIATRTPIVGLSADGSRVAFIAGPRATDCFHVGVWTPAAKSIVRIAPRVAAPCAEYDEGDMYDLDLAGSRVTWTEVLGCGNYCDIARESATLSQRRPVRLHVQYGAFLSPELELSPRPPRGLTDVHDGIGVLRTKHTVKLVRLADHRTLVLRRGTHFADLEADGLYYSYTAGDGGGRVAFMSRAEILRQLG